MERINAAIIGGSFNPIHIGHMQLAELVAKHPDIDTVMLVPSYKSVFGKNLESFEDRFNMCQIVTDSLNRISRREHFNKTHGIYFSVLDIEKRLELDGYTISLAAAIKKDYPQVNPYFVIGQDVANEIHKYKDHEKLIQEETFIIVPRAGYEPIQDGWYMNGKHIFLTIDEPLLEASSSSVREYLHGCNIWTLIDKVPTGVLEYIVKHNLYVNK